MTCHQSNSSLIPLGPTIRNLNRFVERNGTTQNQLSYLQNAGLLNNFNVNQEITMVDYKDLDNPLHERARAYLAMNCSHCHNPNSWERAAEREFDFRYDTPLNQTGIIYEEDKITRVVQDGEMPLIGTTMIDEEGVNLIIEFIENL